MADDEAPVPEADVAPAAVVEPKAAPVAEEPAAAPAEPPQVIEPEPAPTIVEAAPEPAIHAEDPPPRDYAAERIQRVDDFVARAKQAVSDALAAQPFHGTTVMFDDLTCVANAIIDSLAAEMRG